MPAFQRMFSFWLHFSGRFFSAEWPCRSGPRNSGQFSALRPQAPTASDKHTHQGFMRNIITPLHPSVVPSFPRQQKLLHRAVRQPVQAAQ